MFLYNQFLSLIAHITSCSRVPTRSKTESGERFRRLRMHAAADHVTNSLPGHYSTVLVQVSLKERNPETVML